MDHPHQTSAFIFVRRRPKGADPEEMRGKMGGEGKTEDKEGEWQARVLAIYSAYRPPEYFNPALLAQNMSNL